MDKVSMDSSGPRFQNSQGDDVRRLPKKKPVGLRVLLGCFLLGLICVPLAAGAALYLTLEGALGGQGVISGPRLEESSVPPAAGTSRERVTVLLLGTDQRGGEQATPRADTIMVATMDPASNSAGLISLPRDLWVTIPGHGNDRINAAYELGERTKPGGGVELTRKTVEQLLGVQIHHYAIIGFDGFEKLVDEVGGVVVDVERPIKDNEYPDKNHNVRRIFFQPGLQRLNGESALWYVRTRHADSDFGRARRQQQFLLGLRRQALQLNLLPKAPAILGALSDTIRTDLRPGEAIALARAAKDLDGAQVVNRVINESMTTHWVTPAGAQVEVPDLAAVKKVVREVFEGT